MFNLRKLLIPTGEHKEVEVVQTWEVRWTSIRYTEGNYGVGERREVVVFIDEDAAHNFAARLKEAHALTKVSGVRVTVTKAT